MRNRPIRTLLDDSELFRDIDPDVLSRIALASEKIHLPKGSRLHDRLELIDGVFLVVAGEIAEQFGSPRNKERERIYRIVTPGQTFGENFLFAERMPNRTEKALKATTLIRIPTATFLMAFDADSRLRQRLAIEISRRQLALLADIDSLAVRSTEQRVIRYLIDQFINNLGAGDQEKPGVRVTLPMSKGTFASRLNMAPATLSRILRNFCDASLIAMEGRNILIPDIDRLRFFSR
jgi:CRP-like cAMP-binding protein